MPDIIHLLPDSVSNQIAAGEVIQRPASAVKELLENSIDAGATQIDLIIKDAGKTLIQVIDNGCGMSETDARLCFERHATSKIRKVDDLFSIRTMGFRGEALASIAAIAHVELKTKKINEELGTCIIIEGSDVRSQEICHCPDGSTVAVKNLFYNVPARRNFLKSNNVEIRHILEEFQRVAIAHQNIGFSLFHNNRPVFQLRPENLKQRLVSIFGNTYNKKLVPVEEKMSLLSVNGFIGKPQYARKTRGEQYFFVNNRFMKHPYLNHAVDNAFKELLPEKSFPSYFLFIEIDPKEIDINIHPTKTEIKFQDEKIIYSILKSAVRQSLGKFSITPSLNFDAEPTFDFKIPPKGQVIKPPQIRLNPDYNPFESHDKAITERERRNRENWEKLYPERNFTSGKESIKTSPETGQTPDMLIDTEQESVPVNNLFQLHRRYILTQIKSGLMAIDQQKAHERILFERFADILRTQESLSQQELFPINLSLSPTDAELLLDILEDLNMIGFNIEPNNEKKFRFIISGTPADLTNINVEELIEGILENFKRNRTDLNLDKKINLARSMAKNISIKSGKILQQEEMKIIIDELFACKAPEISLDGEAIISIISIEELEKRFHSGD